MTVRCQGFVEAEKQADRNVAKACECLEVSRSASISGAVMLPRPARSATPS